MDKCKPDDRESQSERAANDRACETPPASSRREQAVHLDEQALFGGGPEPRLFGEGSYAEGGSNEEGNYKARDTDPHGSYGSFDDAGGYGATQLLGEREPHVGAAAKRAAAVERPKPGKDIGQS